MSSAATAKLARIPSRTAMSMTETSFLLPAPRRARLLGAALSLAFAALPALATDAPKVPAAEAAILPPSLPFSGESRSLIALPEDPWITPFEKSGCVRTPRYDETVAWLRKLVDSSPELRLTSIGLSPEGREIWMVIASRDRAFGPDALAATGKPLLLAQAGIHSGEIDGKDAGMMLLRDMTARGTKSDLLDRANFLFVPIFSVDAHERFSRFTRLNQRGPVEAGWRTTARNLNLNRDYGNCDSAEMRAMVRTLVEYEPDLYLDLHVTDGADYQYDITWGYNGRHAHSPAIAAWLDERLTPRVERDLRAMGHVPGPLVFLRDEADLSKGNVGWTAGVKFSNGYGDARHLPTVLVENHSLKPYDQRVLGTYVLLEAALRALGEDGSSLRRAIEADRARRPAEVPLAWGMPADGAAPALVDFLGIESRLVPSPITGRSRVEWTGRPITARIPHLTASRPTLAAKRAKAYWVPAAWTDVIERLSLHGIRMERLAYPREADVEAFRIVEAELGKSVVEGRVPIAPKLRPERRRMSFAPGSARVPTDQPLGDLAALLLEPEAPDSYLRCGFFAEVLQRTEYAEGYILEPMAERMLAEDEGLRREFEAKLAGDAAFADDPGARIDWFYRRTPYFDEAWRLYPVARE